MIKMLRMKMVSGVAIDEYYVRHGGLICCRGE